MPPSTPCQQPQTLHMCLHKQPEIHTVCTKQSYTKYSKQTQPPLVCRSLYELSLRAPLAAPVGRLRQHWRATPGRCCRCWGVPAIAAARGMDCRASKGQAAGTAVSSEPAAACTRHSRCCCRGKTLLPCCCAFVSSGSKPSNLLLCAAAQRCATQLMVARLPPAPWLAATAFSATES